MWTPLQVSYIPGPKVLRSDLCVAAWHPLLAGAAFPHSTHIPSDSQLSVLSQWLMHIYFMNKKIPKCIHPFPGDVVDGCPRIDETGGGGGGSRSYQKWSLGYIMYVTKLRKVIQV